MTVRYGLIGAGMMGQEHIRNIALLEGAEVAAIADPDPGMRNAASDLAGGSARVFETGAQLVSAGICDAFVIAAPNDTHHAILLDCLPSNKPVLVEKPLCTTSADCREIIRLVQRRTAPVWVAMEYRFMPPLQRLVQELEDGAVGPPVMMSIREHRFPFLSKVGDWNRFNRRTGGTMVEKCCHFWDLMRFVLKSDPVRVFASAGNDVNHADERYDGQRPDILDNAFVILEFENGTRGMLDLCMFAEGSAWQEVISVTGPVARIDACVPGPSRFSADEIERSSRIEICNRATRRVEIHEVEVSEEILRAGDHHGSTYFQHKRFLDLVRSGNSKAEVTVEDGLWTVVIGEAAENSARLGQAVEIGRI